MNTSSARHVTHTGPPPGILVVDEDNATVQALQALLQVAGFRVYAAGSTATALSLFRENAADIALVLSDLDLPDEDGLALLRRLRALAPGLPFCFMRGSARTYTVGLLFQRGATQVFGKPLDWGQVCQELLRMAAPAGQP